MTEKEKLDLILMVIQKRLDEIDERLKKLENNN